MESPFSLRRGRTECERTNLPAAAAAAVAAQRDTVKKRKNDRIFWRPRPLPAPVLRPNRKMYIEIGQRRRQAQLDMSLPEAFYRAALRPGQASPNVLCIHTQGIVLKKFAL